MLFVLILSVMAMSCNSGHSSNATTSERISFYEVPLVCGAAPEIGCGSRAKPALLELENDPAVKEAWLNRQGTAIAVVWKDKPQTQTVTKPLFEKSSISYLELNEMDAGPLKANFRKKNEWFRGSDVDVLSTEEARTIAENSVMLALEQQLITTDEASKMKRDVENYFKTELVKIRTNEQLNQDSENKFRTDMIAIGEKYIGKERTLRAMALYEASCKQQCRSDKSCTAPGTKACCEK